MNLAVYLKIGALSFVTLDSLAIEMYPSPMKKNTTRKIWKILELQPRNLTICLLLFQQWIGL